MSSRTVHVIDDDDSVRDALRFLFEITGYEVKTYELRLAGSWTVSPAGSVAALSLTSACPASPGSSWRRNSAPSAAGCRSS